MSTSCTASGTHADSFPILDERQFVGLGCGTDCYIEEASRLSEQGLWAQMAKTINTFRSINHTLFLLSSGQISMAAAEETNIVVLARQLDSWADNLPQRLIFTTENLEYFKAFGFGKTFLAMHIGYHHFQQLLYFPYLDSHPRSTTPQHVAYVDLCKKNAMQVSAVARIAFQDASCNLLYYIIGHILVVSSSIHLHTLLFSDLHEADEARGHLVSNFEILMRLKNYWPVIDVSVGRLRTFQDNCRKMRDDLFVLDNWMVKFLMEHSTKLDPERWTAGGREPELPPVADDPKFSEFGAVALEDNALGSLSALVGGKSLSNDALIENALSWLLA
ncbi:hypothetical protein BP5796_08851 [Coleophoma crateriformis]|uniref:Transcription factor domain-containing protein n=1 Tax=Coleophoma crateriformis TaxID=565419 RepID=A0A3D8R303_9HELO|nr:hypothetical protein BP5796_08851 [Coleophoma crateriformis]